MSFLGAVVPRWATGTPPSCNVAFRLPFRSTNRAESAPIHRHATPPPQGSSGGGIRAEVPVLSNQSSVGSGGISVLPSPATEVSLPSPRAAPAVGRSCALSAFELRHGGMDVATVPQG